MSNDADADAAVARALLAANLRMLGKSPWLPVLEAAGYMEPAQILRDPGFLHLQSHNPLPAPTSFDDQDPHLPAYELGERLDDAAKGLGARGIPEARDLAAFFGDLRDIHASLHRHEATMQEEILRNSARRAAGEPRPSGAQPPGGRQEEQPEERPVYRMHSLQRAQLYQTASRAYCSSQAATCIPYHLRPLDAGVDEVYSKSREPPGGRKLPAYNFTPWGYEQQNEGKPIIARDKNGKLTDYNEPPAAEKELPLHLIKREIVAVWDTIAIGAAADLDEREQPEDKYSKQRFLDIERDESLVYGRAGQQPRYVNVFKQSCESIAQRTIAAGSATPSSQQVYELNQQVYHAVNQLYSSGNTSLDHCIREVLKDRTAFTLPAARSAPAKPKVNHRTGPPPGGSPATKVQKQGGGQQHQQAPKGGAASAPAGAPPPGQPFYPQYGWPPPPPYPPLPPAPPSGAPPARPPVPPGVCFDFYLKGQCHHNPCKFAHTR
jgi:hypothetical protein